MFETVIEKENWLVINKPAGISVHNEDDSVISYFKKENLNYSPAHRIDKETSGLLLISKKSDFTATLQEALKVGSKRYLAVVRGSAKTDEGIWNNPLEEKAGGRSNPSGKKSLLKSSRTNWKVLDKNQYFSLLELSLETGRTHQIRRHAVLNKHAIVGDSRYGDKSYNRNISKLYTFNRMALHAQSLEIEIEGELFELNCPGPKEFYDLIGRDFEK